MSAVDLFDGVGDWFSSGGGEDAAAAADSYSSAAEATSSFADAIVSGAQMVGGVLAVAGAVTGNKKLLQVGAVLGLGATAISAFSGISDQASLGDSFKSGSEPPAALSAAADEASSANEAANLANTDASALGSAFSAGETGASPVASGGGLIQGAMSGGVQPSPMTTPAAAGSVSAPQASDGGYKGVGLSDSTIGQNTGALNEASNKLNGTPATEQGLFGKAASWLNSKENAGIVKLGTGLIGGAMQGYQQERALEEQRRARDEQRQYVEDQRTRYNRSILDQNINGR
jgi:hypothetical protein